MKNERFYKRALRNTALIGGAAALCTVIATSDASAQELPADNGAAAEEAKPAAPDDGSDILPPSDSSGIFESSSEDITTPQSQWAPEAQGLLTEMRNVLTGSITSLAEARKENDAVRVNCLNEKITAMKGVLKIAENAYISLEEHLANAETAQARYQFQKIRIAYRKLRKLREEAEHCVGVEATWTGGTEVRVSVDDDVVGGDDYYNEDDDFFNTGNLAIGNGGGLIGGEGPVDVRPPPASVFQ